MRPCVLEEIRGHLFLSKQKFSHFYFYLGGLFFIYYFWTKVSMAFLTNKNNVLSSGWTLVTAQ